MQLRHDQLQAHLTRGIAPLYIVQGDEPLLCLETVDQLRAAARKHGATERQVLQFEARSDWSQLTTQSASMSLFAEKRLLEIRLPTGKPGVQGAQALIRFAQRIDPDQISVMLLPRLDKTGKNSEWFNALSNAATCIDVPTIERPALPRWLASRLGQNQQTASPPALEFIADKVEGNLLAAHQEIQKLALLHPAGPLSLEQVQDAVLNVARYSVQQLSEALLAGNLSRAVRIADGLKAEGEALPLVVWKLADDIRTLAAFKQAVAAGRSPSDLRNALRLWGPREGQISAAARRVQGPAIEAALVTMAQVDRASKGLTDGIGRGDPWELLTTVFPAFSGQ